mmetsp:Transcript_5292/g.12621  ORF Transcript_5292/g.12621 Transcript_5292/m.12621 type:complete len:240 (-) Transcript_5292:905-1624(-)
MIFVNTLSGPTVSKSELIGSNLRYHAAREYPAHAAQPTENLDFKPTNLPCCDEDGSPSACPSRFVTLGQQPILSESYPHTTAHKALPGCRILSAADEVQLLLPKRIVKPLQDPPKSTVRVCHLLLMKFFDYLSSTLDLLALGLVQNSTRLLSGCQLRNLTQLPSRLLDQLVLEARHPGKIQRAVWHHHSITCSNVKSEAEKFVFRVAQGGTEAVHEIRVRRVLFAAISSPRQRQADERS